MFRKCSYLKERRGTFVACLVLAAIAAVPMPAWGQWNGTNPVWTNSNVGIGTTAPASLLEVRGGNLRVSRPYDSNGFVFQTTISGMLNVGYMLGGTDSAFYGGAPVMSLLYTGNVGIGTTSPQYKLAVNGTIGAKDIIVTNTGWADYVFKPGYRLRSLSEVSQFIHANGHLPDIPTEAEVREKGVSLGDMQVKLLAKVEELTLHMIQQDKENRELRENLTKENQELRDRLARLEKGATTDSASAAVK